MKLVIPLLLLTASCSDDESRSDVIVGEVPGIQGRQATTALGVTIYVPDGVDAGEISVQLDAVIEAWITYWMDREGWQRSVLLHRARLVPVVFYSERRVAGVCGFYKYGSHAGIALLASYYDEYFKMSFAGVWIAFHELSHGAKNDFH